MKVDGVTYHLLEGCAFTIKFLAWKNEFCIWWSMVIVSLVVYKNEFCIWWGLFPYFNWGFYFFIKKMCRSILACLGMYEHFAPPWNIESLSDSPLLQLGHRTFGWSSYEHFKVPCAPNGLKLAILIIWPRIL